MRLTWLRLSCHYRKILSNLISMIYKAKARLAASAAPQPLRALAPCRDQTGASFVEAHALPWPCAMFNSYLSDLCGGPFTSYHCCARVALLLDASAIVQSCNRAILYHHSRKSAVPDPLHNQQGQQAKSMEGKQLEAGRFWILSRPLLTGLD